MLPLLPSPNSKARQLAIVLFALAPLLIGALGLFLGQDTNWDLRNYHWYNAYAMVNGRFGFDLLPSQLPYFYNPALDVPFYLLASALPAPIAGFILASVQGLNIILLFMLGYMSLKIANQMQKVLACTVLAVLGMLGGGGIAQIGATFYDNITSLGVLLSALLTIRYYPKLFKAGWKTSLPLAILCGFPAGLMMGFKLPSVVFCVGLCGALLFTPGSFKRRCWITFSFGLGVLAGLSLSFGPWACSLYKQFGNPFFPLFNNIFQSSLAPLSSALDTTFLPESWHDRLLFPFIFTQDPYRVGEIPWRDLRLLLLYVLLPTCLAVRCLFRLNKNSETDRLAIPFATRYLLWAATLTYATWLFLFAIYRYILSLEMLAPLLIVMTLGLLPLRLQARGSLAGLVFVIIIVTMQPGTWGRKPQWSEHTVSIDRPALEQSDNLMILMAGYEPYAHVISEFPPHIPFIRIHSGFTSPDINVGINKLIKERIEGHNGPYKLLMPQDQLLVGKEALSYFDLDIHLHDCQPVRDNLSNSTLVLCDAQPTYKLAVMP